MLGVTVPCVMGETLFWWRPESVMMGTLVYILTKLAQGSQHTLGPSSSQVSNHNIPKIEYAELFKRLIPKFYTQIHVIQNHFLWFITKRKDFLRQRRSISILENFRLFRRCLQWPHRWCKITDITLASTYEKLITIPSEKLTTSRILMSEFFLGVPLRVSNGDSNVGGKVTLCRYLKVCRYNLNMLVTLLYKNWSPS